MIQEMGLFVKETLNDSGNQVIFLFCLLCQDLPCIWPTPYVCKQATGQQCAIIYEALNVKNRIKMDGENQNLLSLRQATIAIVAHRLLQ